MRFIHFNRQILWDKNYFILFFKWILLKWFSKKKLKIELNKTNKLNIKQNKISLKFAKIYVKEWAFFITA
jgi:hypothetical protein